MKFRQALNDEIDLKLEALRGIEAGTDKYESAVNGLTKLMEKAIEINKIESEALQEEKDVELRVKQMNEDKNDRLLKNGIAIGGIVLPIAVTIWGTIVTLNFEKEGTVTTMMGRGFINNLLTKIRF